MSSVGKPYKGFCQADDCAKKGIEVMVRGKTNPRCYTCSSREFQAYGRDKPKQWHRHKPTGEKLIFEAIWKKREHYCESCGKWLGDEGLASYFSHIVRTSKNKDLMLRIDNIVLECQPCHDIWDCGTIDKKMKSNIWHKKLEYIKQHQPDLYERLTEQANELQKVTLFKIQVPKD